LILQEADRVDYAVIDLSSQVGESSEITEIAEPANRYGCVVEQLDMLKTL
jgi:hypothetical protein